MTLSGIEPATFRLVAQCLDFAGSTTSLAQVRRLQCIGGK